MSFPPERILRAQIAADQAERGPGETHTARTVMLAAWKCREEFYALAANGQRELLGAPVFGRRKFRHNRSQGGFDVYRRVAYGQDYNISFFSYKEIAQLLNAGKTVVGEKD